MKKRTLSYFLYSLAIKYPTPPNLNYHFNWGVLALICLIVQIISGILLVMFYIPHMDLAFNSIARLMIDVKYGWLLRYLHANVASFFFFVVYFHMIRALFYGSYKKPRQFLWNSGVVIFFLLIMTAFLGYTLPWGQMSFWGATVITNFVSILPIIGYDVLEWLWGGLTVGNATLARFFSLHYFFPFLLLGVVIAHLYKLHEVGSGNPIGTNFSSDKGFFGPYFLLKDAFTVFLFLICLIITIGYAPNALGHSDNWLKANPMSTPSHITPEWYFLAFYAILRAIPDKTTGVVLLLLSIVFLIFMPMKNHDNGLRVGGYSFNTSMFFVVFILLQHLGLRILTEKATIWVLIISISLYFEYCISISRDERSR